MTDKVAFFYTTGTSYTFNILEIGFSLDIGGIWRFGNKELNPQTSKIVANVAGLNGKVAAWNGSPANDPFPTLLNPDVWNANRVVYPAATLGMGPSIDYGINATIKLIKALKPGTPFALGGYSQGAAVMGGVYNQIKSSGGALYSRRNDFLGGVMFGNPRRQVNFRGEIGGTWSGAWDVPGSTTGGHGSFPASGPYARLSGCDPTKWIEFTAPDDIISSTGDSTHGLAWTTGNDFILGKQPIQYAGQFLTQALAGIIGMANSTWTGVTRALAAGGTPVYMVDALGQTGFINGAGHVTYPALGPPLANGTYDATTVTVDGQNYLKPNGQTCYQMALQWLEGKAEAWATAPIAISNSSAAWSTTLVPPAS